MFERYIINFITKLINGCTYNILVFNFFNIYL